MGKIEAFFAPKKPHFFMPVYNLRLGTAHLGPEAAVGFFAGDTSLKLTHDAEEAHFAAQTPVFPPLAAPPHLSSNGL